MAVMAWMVTAEAGSVRGDSRDRFREILTAALTAIEPTRTDLRCVILLLGSTAVSTVVQSGPHRASREIACIYP